MLAMTTPLRVGLLLESFDVPAWVWFAIRDVATSGHARIVVAALAELRRRNGGATLRRSTFDQWVRRALIRLDSLADRRIPDDQNAFTRTDARELLTDVELLRMRPVAGADAGPFNVQDVAELRAMDLDVLLWFGSGELRGDVLGVARAGVWSINHGDSRVKRGGPSGFWEVHHAWPATGAVLEVLSEDQDRNAVLAHASTATRFTSIKRTRNALYWTALPLLARALERLYRDGPTAFREAVAQEHARPVFYSNRRFGWPSAADLVVHAGRRVARLAALVARRLLQRQQWVLFYAMADSLVTACWRLRPLHPPRDRFWADPHVLQVGDAYVVFVEELVFANGKGRIAVIEIDREGRPGPARVVLEEPHHLSYPFVFEHEGEYFMVPESSARGTIDLYRATSFPDRWEFVEHLMTNIDAVDATLLHEDDRWWLFASVAFHKGAGSGELNLYWSERLTGGSWQLHPASPLSTNLTGSRQAGAILRHSGRLYRPAQDGSGAYGRAIVLNEILELSPTAYREEQVTSIEPNWSRRIKRTHTLAHAGRLTVLDALWPRGRWG